MLKPSVLLSSRRIALTAPRACASCLRLQAFRTSAQHQLASSSPHAADRRAPSPPPPSQPDAPLSGTEKFVPKPLGRPIGFGNPPVPGENAGVDGRSWRQRREDLLDWNKHLQRRNELARTMGKPYFRDFTAITKYHSGKSFLANPLPFRSSVALFFPNFQGGTLADPATPTDTTPVLLGKVSVVAVYSSAWGEAQARSFIGAKENPELEGLLKANDTVAQQVEINIEENRLKYGLLRLFLPSLRATKPKEQHPRYFILRRGVTDSIRETIGLLNGKVGYIYVLDEECRIRWAASGDAEGQEREYLNKAVKILIDEAKRVKTKQASKPLPEARPKRAVEKELEAQAVNAGAS